MVTPADKSEDRLAAQLARLHAEMVERPQPADDSAAVPLSTDTALNAEESLRSAAEVLRLIERVRRRESSRVAAAESAMEPLRVGDTPSIEVTAADSGGTRFGRFEIRGLLGHGGYGIVLRAFDTRLKRDVALKIPRLETLLTEELRQRFLREAEAAAILDHPHIVSVYEVGQVSGTWFIVTAYCSGMSLDCWLREHGRPATVPAVQLVIALADAVQHAHERGVVHRDLKPGNILLAFSEQAFASDEHSRGLAAAARITDFGLAKLQGQQSLTPSGSVLGTPAYLAPEQAAGPSSSSDPRGDVYSLGAILYELLCGVPPFQGASVWDTLQQVRCEQPMPVRGRNAAIARDLEAICLKCLEKAPQRRYDSAAELRDDLRRFLDGHTVRARPQSRPPRLLRWAMRHVVASVLTLSCCLLVGAIAAVVMMSRARLQREQLATRTVQERVQQSEAHNQQLSQRLTDIDRVARQRELEMHLTRAEAAANRRQQNGEREVWQHVTRSRELIQQLGSAPEYQRRVRDVLLRAATEFRFTQQGSTSVAVPVGYVAVACDSGMVAASTAQFDKLLVYHTDRAQAFLELPLPQGTLQPGMAFSDDGQWLATWLRSATEELQLALWHIPTGKLHWTLPLDGLCTAALLDFDPLGHRVAVGCRTEVLLIDLHDGEIAVRLACREPPSALAFHPHENRLAVFRGLRCDVIDPVRLTTTASTETVGAAVALAWNRRGDRLAGACQDAGEILVWQYPDMARVRSIPCRPGPLHQVHFHPTGPWIWGTQGRHTRMWDLSTGALAQTWDFMLCGSDALGQRVYAYDSRDRCIETWQNSSTASRTFDVGNAAAQQLTFAAHGDYAAVSLADQETSLWQPTVGQPLGRLATGPTVFSRQSGHMWSLSRMGIDCWRTADRSGLGPATLQYVRRFALADDTRPWRLFPTPDGCVVLCRSAQDQVLVACSGLAETTEEVARLSRSRRVLDVSPDGRWLLDRRQNVLTLHDLHNGGSISQEWNFERSLGHAFRSDGARLLLRRDEQLELWNTGTGACEITVPAGPSGSSLVPACWLAQDQLVALGMEDGTIQLRDAARLQPLACLLLPHGTSAQQLVSSPGGDQVAALTDVQTICWWDLRRLQSQLRDFGLQFPVTFIPHASSERRREQALPPLAMDAGWQPVRRTPRNQARRANELAQAILADPHSSAARYDRVDWLLSTSRPRTALADIHVTLLCEPKPARGYTYLGRVWLQLDDFRRSREFLETALERDPNDATAHALLGRIFLLGPVALRDMSRARQHAARALALRPEDAEVLKTAGLVSYFSGDVETAETQLKRAARASSKPDPLAMLGLGLCFVRSQQLPQARLLLGESDRHWSTAPGGTPRERRLLREQLAAQLMPAE